MSIWQRILDRSGQRQTAGGAYVFFDGSKMTCEEFMEVSSRAEKPSN